MLAASRYCLYSSSRRTSSCRGSSSSSCDLFLAGKRCPRLHFDQQAGHVEKVADGIDIDLFDDGDVFQELLGDRRDLDVDDIQLVLADQVQEQVERAAKDFEFDAKIHICRAPADRSESPGLRSRRA